MIIDPKSIFEERFFKEVVSPEKTEYLEKVNNEYLEAKRNNFEEYKIEWASVSKATMARYLLGHPKEILYYPEVKNLQKNLEKIIKDDWEKYLNAYYVKSLTSMRNGYLGYENGVIVSYEDDTFFRLSKKTNIKYYAIAILHLPITEMGISRWDEIFLLISESDLIEVLHLANESVGVGYVTSEEEIEL